MKLSKEDADLFFHLMWRLQFFVNCEKKIYPKITSVEKYEEICTKEKSAIRAILYKHPELIDAFVQKNSENFRPVRLAVF